MERAGRCLVRELDDRSGDPAPDRRAFMVAAGGEFIAARGAFGLGSVAVALEHELRRAPNVHLRVSRHTVCPVAVDKGFKAVPAAPRRGE